MNGEDGLDMLCRGGYKSCWIRVSPHSYSGPGAMEQTSAIDMWLRRVLLALLGVLLATLAALCAGLLAARYQPFRGAG